MTMRWQLLGEVGVGETGEDDTPIGACVEIDGLFADLPPRARERFTLVGCSPAGALATLGGRLSVWTDDSDGAELIDVLVVDRRASATVPGTEDVELEGLVAVYDRTDAVPRPPGATEFLLQGQDGTSYGKCRDVEGVFRAQGAPPVPVVRLVGCLAEAPLLAAVDQIGRSSDRATRRRFVSAGVSRMDDDGSLLSVTGAVVRGIIASAQPSPRGAGLLDITVESIPQEPLPTGVLDILSLWRPAAKNLWAPYDRTLRHHWAGLALGNRVAMADRPAGDTYHLDGRFVTDLEGFWCAIGEAINGPGGYFGWNFDALRDCLRGGSGARTPFRLVWHDAAVARRDLAGMDELCALLVEEGVDITYS